MKKSLLFTLAIATSFGLGFTFKTMLQKAERPEPVGRVTSIGGIFFKCADPAKVRAWYEANLGLHTNPYGAVFEWRQGADSSRKGFTQWSPFNAKTNYFEKEFMINYRVDNMDALLEKLRNNGVTVVDSVQTDALGKFVHILDIEGNKIELWEPDDVACDNYGKENGMPTVK